MFAINANQCHSDYGVFTTEYQTCFLSKEVLENTKKVYSLLENEKKTLMSYAQLFRH